MSLLPTDFLGISADVTVLDIEPEQFAVLYECQGLFVMRRVSVAVLSRQPTLEEETLARVRWGRLGKAGKVGNWGLRFKKVGIDGEHCVGVVGKG